MKLGLIGARGHSGLYVFGPLRDRPEARVTGISAGGAGESFKKMFDWCRKHGHAANAYDDYRELLDREKPDAVVVDGPFELHAETCVEAFKRGIHVFSEKPVATTWEQVRAVRAAWEEARVVFMGMLGMRYRPEFLAAWRQVRSGSIGRVRMINARKSYRLGKRAPFYQRRDTYGGTIPWVASHAIDWIRWLSGEDFRAVQALHTTRDNGGNGELEMSALCQFTLADDIFASVSADYLRPATAPTHGDDQVRVAGTEGVVEVRHGRAFLINGAAEGEQELPLEPAGGRVMLDDFLAAVRGEGESLISAEDTLVCTEACLLALQSADENRPVTFP